MLPAILAAILCFCVFLPLFGSQKLLRPRLAIAAKGLATCCALALAVWAAIHGGGRLWYCAMALALCAAADIMLELRFYVGMGLFICGHIWYVAWFLSREPLSWLQPVVALCLGVCAVLLFRAWRQQIGERLVPFACYACMLLVMGGCGISLAATGYSADIWTAVGALSFIVSDCMVCHQVVFPNTTKRFGTVLMVLYEGAQFLFALSALRLSGLL